MLLYLLIAAASAGEILVSLGQPVLVFVDGQLQQPAPGTLRIKARNLEDGEHVVEVRNMLNRPITSLTVSVDVNEQVRLDYARKTLNETSRETLSSRAPPSAAELGAIADSIIATPTPTPVAPTPTPAPAAVPTATGTATVSTAFTGLDPRIHIVTVSGRRAQWVPSMSAFVITDLQPRARYEFQLSLNGMISLTNGMTTESPRHETCHIRMLDPLTYAFDSCQKQGPPLTSADLVPFVGGGEVTPAEPVIQAISEGSLRQLIEAVDDASFSSDKVSLIQTAAANNHFECAQVVRLLEPISHSSDKVAAARALHGAIIDPENAHVLEQAFTFSSDKEEIRALFR
ncbi:MAG: hypothetical protein ACI8S6_003078 [Myxococcota bacterium]|jgi:hypothetical protein